MSLCDGGLPLPPSFLFPFPPERGGPLKVVGYGFSPSFQEGVDCEQREQDGVIILVHQFTLTPRRFRRTPSQREGDLSPFPRKGGGPLKVVGYGFFPSFQEGVDCEQREQDGVIILVHQFALTPRRFRRTPSQREGEPKK